MMNHIIKLRHSLDALFGSGTSKRLPSDIDLTFSRKTGRIRTVSYKGELLCTLRIDGSLAITVYFAQILLKNKTFRHNCVEVNRDAAPFVQQGRSVFCKHVVWCGKRVSVAADTPVLFQNQVIAVGRAILSSQMITDLNRGAAVKVRDSLKSHSGDAIT